VYEPGPGEGSEKSNSVLFEPFLYPSPNFILPHVCFVETTCFSHAAGAGLYCPGPTSESPGQYDLSGRFYGGHNPRKSGFPKGGFPKDAARFGPGPGSYAPLESMGKQVLSTKKGSLS
jgi:hypothetical protein